MNKQELLKDYKNQEEKLLLAKVLDKLEFSKSKNKIENTLYNAMLGEISAKDAIQETIADGVDLIPSNMNLSGAEIELVSLDNREYIMKEIKRVMQAR